MEGKTLRSVLTGFLLTLSIIILSFFYLKNERKLIEEEIFNDLANIARVDSKQLISWYKDELYDAFLITNNQILCELMAKYLDGQKPYDRDKLALLLHSLLEEHGYEQIYLYDADSSLLFSASDQPLTYDIREAKPAYNDVHTSGLYLNEDSSKIMLNLMVPALRNDSEIPGAYLVFFIDVSSYLQTVLNSTELHWKDFQMYLLERGSSGNIRVFNLGQRDKDHIFKEIEGDTEEEQLEKAAMAWKRGSYSGINHAGIRVLAYVTPLSGTPWILVDSIAHRELDNALKQRIWIVILFTSALVLLVIVIIAYYFNFSQKKLYHDLYLKQKELSTTLYSIGDAVIATDKQSRITLMNPVAENITGWKEEEARGKSLEKVFHIRSESTGERIDNPVVKVLKKGDIVGISDHTILISRDEKEFQIADSAAPIKNDKNEIIGVVLVFRNISEEYKLKNALQLSEERLRIAANNIDGILYVLDTDLRFLLSKGKKLGVFGLKADQLTGSTLYDYYQTADRDHPMIKKHLQVLRGRKINVESEYNNTYFSTILSPVKNSLGNVVGIIGLTTDITEHRRAYEMLKSSEEKFRSLFENHTAVQLLVDPESGRIATANIAATQFYGWSEEALQKMTIYDINTLSDEEVMKEMEQAKKQKKVYFEFRHKLASGEIRDVEIYSNKVELSGISYLHAIIHDATEKKKLLTELIGAKEKAEESNRLKSAFLANMSHEIRTPLNGILGFTGLITGETLPPPEKRREYAQIIDQSAECLTQIINDILDISKIESGQLQMEYRTINVRDTLSNLQLLYQEKLKERGKYAVKLTLLEPDNDLYLLTDETRFIQLFNNLLDNAIKFTREGEIRFGLEKAMKDNLVFLVSDTGIGVAKEKQEIIFNSFVQADENIQATYGGTGLGLSIVKKIIELMNGKIGMESTTGEGTIFRFVLPYIKPKSIPGKRSEEKIAQVSSSDPELQVLLVEDDPVSLLYYKEILQNMPVRLTVAESGSKTLSLLKEMTPDVILLDIRLPDMNGLDIVKEIRRTNRKTYIIAQSAYAMATDEKKSIEAGCNDFITKPVKVAQLKDKLEAIRKRFRIKS